MDYDCHLPDCVSLTCGEDGACYTEAEERTAMDERMAEEQGRYEMDRYEEAREDDAEYRFMLMFGD